MDFHKESLVKVGLLAGLGLVTSCVLQTRRSETARGCFRIAASKWRTCGNSQKALGLGEMMGSRLRAGLIEVGVLMSLPGRPHLRQYHPNTHWCVLSTPRYLERRKPPAEAGGG